ncbi:MAG TPA: TolC family protein [Methylococcaceae bacterium]|nr:TolC family protein [Methylococcaceae bacterium]
MSFCPSLRPVTTRALYLAGCTALGLSLSGAAPADDTPSLTLEAAVSEALAGNPGLAEIHARSDAMAAVPSQAGALPDPTLRFEAQNLPTDSFDLRDEDMTLLQVGVSQELPFPGKLALKEKAAEYEAAAARDSIEEARLRLVRDVKVLWWQIHFRERALEVLAANEVKLRQLAEVAQARYEVGEGAQQDVLLARLEQSKLREMELGHIRQHHSEIARLNALLDRPGDTPLRLAAPDEAALPEVPSASTLRDLAEHNRPALAKKRKAVDAAKTRVELAEKDYLPDFTVDAGYAARQDTPAGARRSDFASVGVSMNLPLYAADKQGKAVDQRQSELLQEQYALQDALRKVQADVAATLAGFHSAREEVALYQNDILPQAKQTVDAMLAGYRVGKVDFLDLIRAQIAVLEYETRYWQAFVHVRQALAKLAFAAGKEGL